MSRPLLTVAIADDEPGILKILQSALQSHYQIVGTAKNGQEAIQLVQSFKPDLLILDNHMPVLNGMDALKQIAAFKTTAVVMLTADQDLHGLRGGRHQRRPDIVMRLSWTSLCRPTPS